MAIEQIARIVHERTGTQPQAVRLLGTEAGRVVLLTIGVSGEASLVDAHLLAGELEDAVRQELADIADVVVHTEPAAPVDAASRPDASHAA